MKSNVLKKVFFIFLGIISSGLSVLIAYWFIGAIPLMEEGIGYGYRLLTVLKNPFENYFNDYSPIGMVAAFILNEVVFGIIFLCKLPISNRDLDEPDFVLLQTTGDERKREIELTDRKEDEDIVDIHNKPNKILEKRDDESSIRKKNENIEEDKDVFLREDLFLKLFNFGYSMPQINAMMELTNYIPDINDVQLIKMFKPTMDADAIREYIEVFYG